MGVGDGSTRLAGVAALPVRLSGLVATTISTTRQVSAALGVAVPAHRRHILGTRIGTADLAEGFVHGLHVSGVVTASAKSRPPRCSRVCARRTGVRAARGRRCCGAARRGEGVRYPASAVAELR
ncbi:hypothetical protein SALBM311S_06178 [Streptomyces alboniger]